VSGAPDPTVALSARTGRLAARLAERDLDALLVSVPLNVRYLTGFTGSNGMALIAADQNAGVNRFFTDFRYATQIESQVPDLFERMIVTGELLSEAATATATATGRLGFDDAALTVKQHARLRELLPDGWELVPCGGLVERLREVKDPGELELIRAASELAEEALRGLLESGVVGRTERDVAIDLELRMRRLGADGPSFPSIVAAGPHSALPHAEPREQPIPAGALLTIDWGAYHQGYCSDCTRTFATGEVSEQAREVYELVRRAQAQALAAVAPGPTGSEIDQVARAVIDAAGLGDRFGHGLGHGVGMEVHEGPRLSRTGGDAALLVGNVVTVEPGVYLPGRFGVRIEDLVFVTEHGGQPVTHFPKELTVVS
jgi:Xaa-Pro aminopeptidase